MTVVSVATVSALGYAAYRGLRESRLRARVQEAYVEAECTVLSKEVRAATHSGRAHGRDRHRDTHAIFEPVVRYRYRVEGRDFEAERFALDAPVEHERQPVVELLQRYEVGRKYPCWYDPDSPAEAVLDRH